MTAGPFYITKITLTVIGNTSVETWPLEVIAEEVINGELSARREEEVTEVNGLAAAKELILQRSDPEFLGIDKNGNEVI